MIPKSNCISRCIHVNLTFFLDSSTLIPPSPCTFLCVFSLSFIVLFLLEDLSRGVHMSTVPSVLHKSSTACTASVAALHAAMVGLARCPRTKPFSPFSDTYRAPHTVQMSRLWFNQPSRMDVLSSLSLLQPVLEQMSFHKTLPVLFCTSFLFRWAPQFLTPFLCSIASKQFFTQ